MFRDFNNDPVETPGSRFEEPVPRKWLTSSPYNFHEKCQGIKFTACQLTIDVPKTTSDSAKVRRKKLSSALEYAQHTVDVKMWVEERI